MGEQRKQCVITHQEKKKKQIKEGKLFFFLHIALCLYICAKEDNHILIIRKQCGFND